MSKSKIITGIGALIIAAAAISQTGSTIVGSRQFNGILDAAGTTLQNVRQGSTNPSTCGQNPTGSTAGAVESFLNTSTSPAILYDCSASAPNTWVARGVPLSSVSTSKGATLLYGPITFTNVTYPVVSKPAISFGATTALYTVPTNRKAWVAEVYMLNASSAAISPVYITYTPSGGSAYLAQALTGVVNSISSAVVGLIMPAQSTLAIQLGSGSGTAPNVWAYVVEFDASVPVSSAVVLGIASGTNTIFTATAPTFIGSANPSVGSLNLAITGGIPFGAATVESNTYTATYYYVPSGSSIGAATQIYPSTASGTSVRNTFYAAWNPLMATGDSIAFTSTGNEPNGMAWVNVGKQ